MTVQIDLVGAPGVFAGQDGDGPWQPLVFDADNHAQLVVTAGRYGLAMLCEQKVFTTTSVSAKFVLSGNLEDQTVGCGSLIQDVEITGTTAPGADVFTDITQTTAEATTGTYSIGVRPGVHDVFAVLRGTPTRLYAQRSIAFASNATLDLPIATAGSDMIAVTPTITGARGTVTVYADVNTAHDDYVSFGEDPATAWTLPAALLAPGDRPSIGAYTSDCSAQKPATGTAPTLAIAGPFTGGVTPTQATWTADPGIAWEFVRVSVSSKPGTGGTNRLEYFADMAWLAGASSLALVDPKTVAGWHDGLAQVPAGPEVRWAVGIERGDRTADLDSCGAFGMATF